MNVIFLFALNNLLQRVYFMDFLSIFTRQKIYFGIVNDNIYLNV